MVTAPKAGRPGYSQGELQRAIRAFRAEGREVELLVERATGNVLIRPTGTTQDANSTTTIFRDTTTFRKYAAPEVAKPGGLTLEQLDEARRAGRRS